MKLLIKKFKVKRSGAVYGPGDVLDLPDADGQRLIDASPKNYDVIAETKAKKAAPKAEKVEAEPVEAVEAEAKPATKKRRKKAADADADVLPEVDVDALVK